MASLVDRIYKCVKGSSKADCREFTSTCIQLARMIDLAVAKQQKLPFALDLPPLMKKVCEQKDNQMFQPAIVLLLMSVKNASFFGWFTGTDGQELLQMSKELVDFFTGVGGFSPADTSQAVQLIRSISPRFYPQLSLQSVIVALEAKPGYEAMVCDFYVMKKPSAGEELRMFVLRMDNQDTSSCLVTPNHVNFLVNGKGVEKRSLTSMDVGPQMPSNVTGMLRIGTNLLQIVGDFPGNFLIAIALTTSKSEFASPLDLQIFNHDGMKVQTDEELIEGPSRVSLLCPISHKRITTPVKGSSCRHHQCFDYNSFMEINSRRPSWRCPYCNRSVSFPDLQLDLRMLKIIKDTQAKAVDVMVSEDGSWEILNNEEMTKKTMGSRKKGQIPNTSGDSSTEEGEIRLCQDSINYIELSDTEEPERQGHGSEGQLSAVVRVGTGGVDVEMEERKPEINDGNLNMATSAASGQVEDGRLLAGPSASIPYLPGGLPGLPNMTYTTQSVPNERAGYTALEGVTERQVNREISRSPIAIQALPAQTVSSNNPSYLRARPRSSSHPNSPAQANGGVQSIPCSAGVLTGNLRPLQVQLPSFVGVQDGQVLLNTSQHQQSQQEAPDILNSGQSQQGVEAWDYRQRLLQHLQQQQRTPTPLPPGQSLPRITREQYYLAARTINQARTNEWQTGQVNYQQTIHPTSPNLLDNQIWWVPLSTQQLQQQGLLNLGVSSSREEAVTANLAEGIPLFSQSPGGSPAIANASRSNSLIVPNTNIPAREQRWIATSDAVPGPVDTSMLHIAEQMQRRMRGSINSPGGRDISLNTSLAVSTGTSTCLYGGVTQPSRFSPGVSSAAWNPDAFRQTDSLRSTNTTRVTSVQSIQTASTLVSDFDNWFDTRMDSLVPLLGAGEPGTPRPS